VQRKKLLVHWIPIIEPDGLDEGREACLDNLHRDFQADRQILDGKKAGVIGEDRRTGQRRRNLHLRTRQGALSIICIDYTSIQV
jgi:hypothetical protein